MTLGASAGRKTALPLCIPVLLLVVLTYNGVTPAGNNFEVHFTRERAAEVECSVLRTISVCPGACHHQGPL